MRLRPAEFRASRVGTLWSVLEPHRVVAMAGTGMSSRAAAAANAMAGPTCSSVREGKSLTISWMLAPSARSASTARSRTRVPELEASAPPDWATSLTPRNPPVVLVDKRCRVSPDVLGAVLSRTRGPPLRHRQLLLERLGDQEAVEGIAVVERQGGHAGRVLRGRSAERLEAVLRRAAPGRNRSSAPSTRSFPRLTLIAISQALATLT